ncbi:MAG: alpha-galactosidase, partial [Vallitaleaceae bacterium]|nr:alpha-galactosidase [Vallitaleaceae bacterium]
GIWVEPEMVNEESALYKKHPEWVLKNPFGEQSLGRNQMVLDLTRKEVQEYLIESMSRLLASAEISYVKWDMNRVFSEVYSASLPSHRQGEVAHRYILGLYHVLDVLTERFPKILFEACAAGGNRFDLGMLCYMPQIWASDDTDAAMRRRIQEGYSYGYPLSVISAHVSGTPNHQTLREISLETRFHIALFGLLGYECNLNELSKEEQAEVREQIRIYKQWREVLQFGDFYRIRRKDLQNVSSWITVSTDRKKAVGMLMQDQVIPNQPHWSFRARGLEPNALYRIYGRKMRYDIRVFGDLINTIAPIHIKKNSLIHRSVARFVKLDGETQEGRMYGATLENAGYTLKQGFIGMGYNNEVRLVTDYSSRIYFLEELGHEEESPTSRD